jgi:bifunctional non-homologous end joining protein LigD
LAGLGDPDRLQVTHSEAVSKAERKGDLFGEVLVREQKLPHL